MTKVVRGGASPPRERRRARGAAALRSEREPPPGRLRAAAPARDEGHAGFGRFRRSRLVNRKELELRFPNHQG